MGNQMEADFLFSGPLRYYQYYGPTFLQHLWYRVRQMDLTVIFVIFQKREARSHQVNIVEALKLSSYPRLENARDAPLAMILCFFYA